MEIRTVRDIGALIRDRRNRLGLTQEDLATRVGASRLWVVQLEKGKSTAQISLVLRALRELGLILDASIYPHADAKDRQAKTIDLDAIIDRAKSAKP